MYGAFCAAEILDTTEEHRFDYELSGTGEACALARWRGRIALANAQDEPALAALVRAQRAGAAEGTLIGPADEIARLLRRMGEQVSDYEIVPFTGTELDAAKLAVRTVREGRADMLMKGLLHTADFARAILNRETGLMPQTGRRLLSQCGFFQYDGGSF